MKLFCLVLLALLWAAGSTYAQTPVMLSGGRIYEGDLEDGEAYGFGDDGLSERHAAAA